MVFLIVFQWFHAVSDRTDAPPPGTVHAFRRRDSKFSLKLYAFSCIFMHFHVLLFELLACLLADVNASLPPCCLAKHKPSTNAATSEPTWHPECYNLLGPHACPARKLTWLPTCKSGIHVNDGKHLDHFFTINDNKFIDAIKCQLSSN